MAKRIHMKQQADGNEVLSQQVRRLSPLLGLIYLRRLLAFCISVEYRSVEVGSYGPKRSKGL